MRLKSHFARFLILLILALATANAVAQVDEKEKVRKETEKRQELERKTLVLVDEIAAGAWGLKLPENRSFVLVSAADLTWRHDEKRARALFWEALNSLNLPTAKPLADASAKDQPKKEPAKPAANTPTQEQVDLRSYYATYEKRRNFLRHVATSDLQLALDMLHATAQPPPKLADDGLKTADEFRPPGDTELEQEIATDAAVNDPKRALQIARESLSRGLTYQAGNLLFQLNQKDQNAATEFAGDIIAKLSSESLDSNMYAPIVLNQLLGLSRTDVTVAVTGAENLGFRPLKLSDEQKQNLVDLLVDAVLRASAKPYLLQTARSVMQEIEQFAPERVARVKQRLAELSRSQNRELRGWTTDDSLQNATPEEMIKASRGMGDERREAIYREAVIKAVLSGRGDSLREFINNQFEDGAQRNELIDQLDEEQIGLAANKGQDEALQKLTSLIRRKEQRALAMAELAVLMEKKGRHDDAVTLLNDAQSLVKLDLRDYKQSRALMTFLFAYALVDPNKAFAIIEPFIDKTNDSISKLLVLDKITRTGVARNGEILIEQPGIPLDFAMFKYGPGVLALAEADFNRTRAAADRFERNEVKIMARLLMAQSILKNLEAKKSAEVTKGGN